MNRVDELTLMDGEFVLRIYDLEEEGNGVYEIHIEDAEYDDITAFREGHILYPVYFAQFHALKKAYTEFFAANRGEGDAENLDYWEDMVSGLERSFKAIFHAYRGTSCVMNGDEINEAITDFFFQK